MTRCTCLTCKHWKRHSDPVIGACWVVDLPLQFRWRGQHEACTEDSYQFGEDRPAVRFGAVKNGELVDRRSRPLDHKICQYYAAPFGGVA